MIRVTTFKPFAILILTLPMIPCSTFAQAQEDEVQDMSDPLAVYTQVGAGYTNRGINIKLGRTYDTGSETSMGMNLLELIGGAGEAVGWDEDEASLDNSFDSLRFRNFKVDTTNGRGSQIDIQYNFDETALAEQSGTASYGLIQALPKMGSISLYPLAGAGLNFGNNVVDDDGSVDSGYSINGTYALLGMYGRLAITDKIWLNYNPFWLTTLSGSDNYKDNAYGSGNSHVLTHELALSYQFTPVFNVRYFANWNENVNFSNGDHRIEFNYQL